jgi:type II secretory pathway component PulF
MSRWFPTFQSALRFRLRGSRAQQQGLLRMILVATEENVPLVPLLAAWADDETGMQQVRLDRLTELLRAGTALPDAVEEVHGALSEEDVLAIRFGTQSGTFAASLGERLQEPAPASLGVAPRWRKLTWYIGTVLVIGFFIVTFLQIKIMPELNYVMHEFDVAAPASFNMSVAFAKFFESFWPLLALATALLAWLTFMPWPGRRFRRTVLTRFFRPVREFYTAGILDTLRVAVDAGRPVAGAISTLARYHFDPTLRNQLLFVRNEMEQGTDVWQSMASIGLLTPPERKVMETADRIGNRPWALEQIALVKRRKTLRRMSRWSELLLPIAILGLGAFVLMQALGVFSPLIQILYKLA